MRTIFIIISTKYFAVFCWDKAKLLHYFFFVGVAGLEGGTNICTSICIYFGILFNNFSLCPFSKYTNTRRGAQTHENTIKNTHTDRSFLCAYIPRGGGGAGVCCIFIYPLHSVGARLVESNRIELTDNVVLSGATQTTQWARSGLEKSSRVPKMKNSNVLLRPNNFPPPNRECVCSESAREEVQKRAVHRERESENVSCNWNMLPESEKPTMRKGLTLSNFTLSSLYLLSDWEMTRERESESEMKLAPSSVWTSCCYSQLGLMPTADETSWLPRFRLYLSSLTSPFLLRPSPYPAPSLPLLRCSVFV